MNGRDPHLCPICACRQAEVAASHGDVVAVKCPNCGDHMLAGSAEMIATMQPEARRPALAYAIRKLPDGRFVSASLLQDLANRSSLPDASERLDNLVIHLAATQAPGQSGRLVADYMCAPLGTANSGEAQWVIREASRLGLISAAPFELRSDDMWTAGEVALTMNGWAHHRDLMRNGAGSRHAFMAMQFGDTEVDGLFRNHLQRAVEQTGFELRTTTGAHQTAGSIDNRMRVEIRTSRFVVCDLTHGNRGAYWEAGFAEGLGRPVIYICRRDVLASQAPDTKPHFDIRQQLIIGWDLVNPGPAMDELKATIRATLPAEARMQDA